jgi:hypothetical protein
VNKKYIWGATQPFKTWFPSHIHFASTKQKTSLVLNSKKLPCIPKLLDRLKCESKLKIAEG